jgi:uncharacterized protein (DUF427 family)
VRRRHRGRPGRAAIAGGAGVTAIADLHAVATGTQATVRVEPCPRRLRVVVGDAVVADTSEALYLFERGHLPVYYFPRAAVRWELLRPSATRSECPRKGVAEYWNIEVGDHRRTDAVWAYPEVIGSCPDITGHVAFWWDRVDAWFEEDDEVFVHARDPYKRIDVVHSSRHVVVAVDGDVVAESRRPRVLFETGLPTRYYLPLLDVRPGVLVPSTTVTRCPYKGVADYFSVRSRNGFHADLAWRYRAPIPEASKIENLVCFFNERVDLTVDGVALERPSSPWSPS